MRVAERVASPALYDLPQEFSEEIGRIVVRWAYLEHYVQRIVWMLLELDSKRGRLAVRDPSMQERIVMISDFASLQAIKLELSAFLNNAKVTAGQLWSRRRTMDERRGRLLVRSGYQRRTP